MRKLVVLLVWFALAGTVFAQGRGGSRGGVLAAEAVFAEAVITAALFAEG